MVCQKKCHQKEVSAHKKSLARSLNHTNPKAYSILSGLFCLLLDPTRKREIQQLFMRKAYVKSMFDAHFTVQAIPEYQAAGTTGVRLLCIFRYYK